MAENFDRLRAARGRCQSGHGQARCNAARPGRPRSPAPQGAAAATAPGSAPPASPRATPTRSSMTSRSTPHRVYPSLTGTKTKRRLKGENMTTTAVVHKTIDLRHGKTRYIDVGSGEPLLVLHISSIEGGADDCLATLDVLSSKFRVIAPDLIGWPPTRSPTALMLSPTSSTTCASCRTPSASRSGMSLAPRWVAGLPASSLTRAPTA